MGDNNDNDNNGNQNLQQVMQQAMQAALQAVLGQDPSQNPVVQALVQNQVQQAMAQLNVTAGGQQQQPPPPQAVQLGAAPAGDAPWSLSESTGLKVYMAVISPFSPLYDGEEKLLSNFLRMIYVRFENYGIETIFTIKDDDKKDRDITREYGALTKTNVVEAAKDDLKQTNRRRQAQEFLYKLIQGSVTPRLLDRLVHRKDDYTVDIAVATTQNQSPAPVLKTAGAAQLYQLVSMLAVQTKATVASLLNKLDNMTVIMEECKSDVELFNATIDKACDELRARKTTPPDLLAKLFAGYTACDDTTFVEYISRKEEMYLDDTLPLDADKLMKLALEKCKIMFYDKKCWLKKTPKELEFIAMQSELAQLRQAPAPAQKKKKKDQDQWAWKLVAPKPGEPHEIVKNGKTYVHCPHHKKTQWVLKVNDGKVHFDHCEKHLAAVKDAEAKKKAGQSTARVQALATVMENPDASGADGDAEDI